MIRSLAAGLALALALPALAEGPGTRIRSGSGLPPQHGTLKIGEVRPCDRLRGDEKERCLAGRKPSPKQPPASSTSGSTAPR